MESPIKLILRSSEEANVKDKDLIFNGASKLKTTPSSEQNGSVVVPSDDRRVIECKAAYLGVKKTVGDDLMSMEELTRALQHAGFNPSQQNIEKYWPNNTGSVTFDKFCDFVESECSRECTDPVTAFQKLDPENCGRITFKELQRFMTTKGEKMSDDEFSKIFESSPFVKDGNFDYRSFCAYVTKTVERCRHISLEATNSREKEFQKNSNTFVVKKKNGTKGRHHRTSSYVSENEANELIDVNFKDWPKLKSKGCFYYDKPKDVIVSHQFVLDVPDATNVWLTIEPLKNCFHSCVSDTLVYILREGDNKARELVSFTENRDSNGRYYLGTHLDSGRYVLLPFTSGHHIRKFNEALISAPTVGLVEKQSDNTVSLTKKYKRVLEEIFSVIDLDGNGRLSRQEFTLFQWQTCGEEVQDDEWAALEATFELEDGELTLNGFIDAHLLEAENNFGNPDELWKTLQAMGYNGQLELQNALPFSLEIHTEEPDCSLNVSALKSGGNLLEMALCRCITDNGRASKVRNLNDLILYTYVSKHHAMIAVHNKAHSRVAVRMDCSSSQNCSSHRGTLDYTLECLPKSLMIGHHLMPSNDHEPWQVSCIESVVK